MDCTDIRVLLSGLIDDEVDGDTRHAAERHLAECAECRALIDEAESLNQLIVTSTAGADGIEPLSPDFIGNVLSRTVYARPTSRRSTTDWTSWLGWFAAAAALLMAVVLWFDDQRVTPEDIPVIRSASVSPNMQPSLHDYIYSSVLAIAPDGDYDEAADWSSLTRDDVDTLDSAALVLEMLLVEDADSFARVDEAREIAVYDELLDRLAIAQDALGGAERLDVHSAASALFCLVNGPMSSDDLQQLRISVKRLDLPAKLTAMAARWTGSSTL